MSVMVPKVVTSIIDKAKELNKKIVLPEAGDVRTLLASRKFVDEQVAQIILLGNSDSIHSLAKEKSILLDGIEIIDPQKCDYVEELAQPLFERRKAKGLTLEDAINLVKTNTLYFADLLVETGRAYGSVAGAVNSTGDVVIVL